MTGVHYSMSMQTYLYVDMYGERAKYIDLQYGSKTNISSGQFGCDLAVEEVAGQLRMAKIWHREYYCIVTFYDLLKFLCLEIFDHVKRHPSH